MMAWSEDARGAVRDVAVDLKGFVLLWGRVGLGELVGTVVIVLECICLRC